MPWRSLPETPAVRGTFGEKPENCLKMTSLGSLGCHRVAPVRPAGGWCTAGVSALSPGKRGADALTWEHSRSFLTILVGLPYLDGNVKVIRFQPIVTTARYC
jgi:hypothetical protein